MIQWFSKDGGAVTEVGTGHRIGMRILSFSWDFALLSHKHFEIIFIINEITPHVKFV